MQRNTGNSWKELPQQGRQFLPASGESYKKHPRSVRGIHIKSTRATPENPYKKHPRNSGEPI